MHFVLALLLFAAAPGVEVEVLPPGASAKDRLPMVVALHGRGGNAAAFARRVKAMKLRARVVAVQAPDPHGGGFSWFEYRLAGNDEARLTEAIRGRAAALRARIAELAKERPTCGAPVLLGYSQGGALAMAVAADSSAKEIAGAVELAGALPPSYPMAAVSDAPVVWGAHGTTDQVVPVDIARRTFARAVESGRPWKLEESDVGHDLSKGVFARAAEELRRSITAACPESG